jgi:hypothetical protein
MISRGCRIEIRKVANGYITMPSYDTSRAIVTDESEIHVFESFANLATWLAEHFAK